MNNGKNWLIITPNFSGATSETYNLDFVSKVEIDRTNFYVYLVFGTYTDVPTSGSNAFIQWAYASLADAEVDYAKIQAALRMNGAVCET